MRGYGIEGFVYEWLNEVKGLKESMWKLIQSNRHPVLVECFNGSVVKIPNPGKRHRLARQADKGKDEVVGCCNKEKTDMTEISYLIHQQQHHLAGTNFINLQTHTTLITDVLQKLEEGDGMMIGIYGIRGVGKSTVVRMIEVGARKSGKYAKVEIAAGGADVGSLHASIVNILTEVHVASHHKLATKPPNVHKEEAAGDGDDDEKIITTTKNARPLDRDKGIINKTVDHPTGNDKMRVLIIVDNLSYKIDLAAYIVEGKNNYKLQFLVTSTSNDLLASINCHPIQQLRALRNPEARQLLTHLIGPDKAAKLGNIPEDQLRNCCGGLPVFIEALAQIIKRSNSANLWDDAIKKLPRNLDSVDTVLKLSYNQLEGQVKLLYSLCAILGQTSQVEHHLLRYSVGMGLFDKITTMAAVRNKMSEGLESLLGSSLLLGTENNNQITIQDARRNFATKCAFKSHYLNEASNLEIFIMSDAKDRKRKHKKKNSSVDARIVHDKLVPQFATKWAMKGRNNVLVLKNETQASIFISSTNAFVDDPLSPSEMESFFQLDILEKLKVLHLEKLCFTAGLFPPPSSVVLKDLVTLCLHNCDVKDMSGIGNLESLQVISFFGSVVAKLLKEVGELKKLRSLDFRGCLRVKQIEAGALEGLSSLEELFLGSAFDKWEADKGAPHQKNASLAELNNMNRLATLDVCIPNPDVLPDHVAFSTVLKRYSLHIGEWDSDPNLLDNNNNQEAVVPLSRTLKLNLDSSRVLLNGWFQATMKRAQQLHLKGLTDDSKRSIHELCISGGTGFEELKRLEIRNCPSTRYVVRSTEWFERAAFTCLEFLSLDSLINLEKIGHGLLSPKSFGKLKTVAVRNCENLGSLFSLSSIHGLSQLKRIEIYECNRLQAIVVDERTYDCAGGVTLFDKKIHRSLTHVDHDQEEMEEGINNNDQLSALSFKMTSSSGPTENIEDQAKVDVGVKNQNSGVAAAVQPTDKLVVSPENGKITMHELRELIIEKSPIFSTFFTQVQPKMTENNQRDDEILNLPACLFCGDDKISFPKLENVALRNIDKVKEIWQMSGAPPVDLGNLQSLSVQRCTSLLSIFHPNLLEKYLQELESLTIEECPLIQVVFDLKPVRTEKEVDLSGSGTKRKILPKLKRISVMNLSNLKYIVSNKNPSRLLGFENLSSLDVAGCGELEYIFTYSMAKAMKKLKNITIIDCAKMKAIIVSDEVEDGDQQVGSKIELPALKVLKIDNCPNMGGFSGQISATLEVLPDKDIPTSHPEPSMMRYLLCYGTEEMAREVSSDCTAAIIEEPITFFTQKVHLPSLVELKFSSTGNFTKIWQNEPQTEGSFSKLSSFKVSNCKQLDVAFPATILDRLEHLRDIEISECPSLRVLFELQTSKITKRTSPVVLSSLKEVVLSNLSKLEHIVQKDTKVLVGFPRLTKIDVSSCDKLIDLMPVATATSLLNLETLTLSRCSKIKEVVGGSGYKDTALLDDIAFPLLVSLELRDLKSLVHFSCETYQLDFPSLKILKVDNCTKMKIFCPVPTYERLEFDDNASPRHHQSLFNERVGLPKLEELVIQNMKLKELWSTEPFTRSFWHLKLLQVENCHQLQNIIPSFMLKRLRNLETMIIIFCRQVQHIAGKSDEGVVEFPYLTDIRLRWMPRLCSFCSGSNAIKLPLLKRLVVQSCKSLDCIAAVLKDDGAVKYDGVGARETATADSNCSKIQIQQPFFWFDNQIAFPNLKELTIEDNVKLSIIFYGQVDSLSRLSKVTVTDCDKMRTMFNSNVLRTLTNLESLVVYWCQLLEVGADLECPKRVPGTPLGSGFF